MNKPIDPVALDSILQRAALDKWLSECKRRMALRFPRIDFLADEWPIRRLYQTEQSDWYFTAPMAGFSERDISYGDALRCLVAEMIIAGRPKSLAGEVAAYRQLALNSPYRLFDLTLSDLRRLEERLLANGKANPQSANRTLNLLVTLAKFMTRLSRHGVVSILGWRVNASTKAELVKIHMAERKNRRKGKDERLDRSMEAFNEAFNRMVDGAPELSARDRVAISTGVLLLCAPSRINEPLCMSIDDHVTVEEYAAKNTIGELDEAHRAHQMLIMTMKGSKGAQWSAKPVLSFMIDAFHYAIDVIKSHGKRSRMLVEWYQQHPDTLYLPPELEYLRGQAVSRRDLRRIIQLDTSLLNEPGVQTANSYFNELKDRQFKAPNSAFEPRWGKMNGWKTIDYVSWADVEALLLRKVHEAMDRCRRVTPKNHFKGNLAKMLFLFDDDERPAFRPSVTTYGVIQRCYKVCEIERKRRPAMRSFFEKLNITIPVDGAIRIAQMNSHDPRRWLTTMALTHGEMLSDVLINKWANRSKLSQLKAYDFRTAEAMAVAASMPKAEKLTELTDLSNGLAAVEKLEEQCSLQTAIVTAHDAGVAVTSLDAVAQAVDERPVARTGRGIIVIYPQKYGVCLHQHHEKPCRNYSNELSASCLTCDEAVQQKGHIPTNDALRDVDKKLFSIIVRHLEYLAVTHNRNVADDPAMLGDHMLTLVEKGLSLLGIEQLANELIDSFQEANRLLKDRRLANLLEQAFVARESVKILDASSTSTGAIFKYHNPTRHSEPLMEIALDEFGGREQVVRDEELLVAKHPHFAPTPDSIMDQRHLITPDDDEED